MNREDFSQSMDAITQRAEIERLQAELKELKQLNHPICLICGRETPCELKDDPQSPCTFDLTPKQLHTWCKRLRAQLATAKGDYAGTFTEFLKEREREQAKVEAAKNGQKEQIRERCARYYQEEYPGLVDAARGIPGLESLYREAMAEGLERAALQIVDSEDDFTRFVKEGGYNVGIEFQVSKFAKWCRQEAARVKEGRL